MISRRQFIKLGALGACGFGAAAGGASSIVTTDRLEVTRLDLALPDLAADFEGYRIAFISDIHYGPFVSQALLEEVVAAADRAAPDLVLLGGDHLNVPELFQRPYFWYVRNRAFNNVHERGLARTIYGSLADRLRQIRVKDGIFSVYGNHDRWLAPRACAEVLGAAGMRVLVNETAEIRRGGQSLKVIGVDDYWTGVPAIPSGLHARTRGETRILLAHNPDFIARTLDRTPGCCDLALAGHTHGGQICAPLIGPLHYNVLDHRFAVGLKRHRGALVYTTRGVGVVELPFRINCPPEVCIFTLRRA